MDPDAAINYVRENGDLYAQARLAFILYQDTPPPELIANLFSGQRSDGGWPPAWAAHYSSLDATCNRLGLAYQLGLSISDVRIARGCGFLALRQGRNGGWEEERIQSLAAPERVKPGRRSANLYITANCGFWMAVMEGGHSPVAKAARYLLQYIGEDDGLPSFTETHWLTGALFYRINWRKAAGRLINFLTKRLDKMCSRDRVGMLKSLIIAGVPREVNLIKQGIMLVEGQQLENGAWACDDKPSGDIHTTLETIAALRLCGRL